MGWAGLTICALVLTALWAMVGWWQEKHWRKALEEELAELDGSADEAALREWLEPVRNRARPNTRDAP